MRHPPTCLTIAGFDGSGGAGIQADVKTFSALGCHGLSVLTALPIQNHQGVHHIYAIPPNIIKEQLTRLFEENTPDCIKIGMLLSTAIIHAVADYLNKQAKHIPIILDPVMAASSGGHPLLQTDALPTLKATLIPMTTLLTPNIPEANQLTGPYDTIEAQANDLLTLGTNAVLLKGGHAVEGFSNDVLFEKNGQRTQFTATRIDTQHTRGTGCMLSSAICTYLAKGFVLSDACLRAKQYVRAILQQTRSGLSH